MVYIAWLKMQLISLSRAKKYSSPPLYKPVFRSRLIALSVTSNLLQMGHWCDWSLALKYALIWRVVPFSICSSVVIVYPLLKMQHKQTRRELHPQWWCYRSGSSSLARFWLRLVRLRPDPRSRLCQYQSGIPG